MADSKEAVQEPPQKRHKKNPPPKDPMSGKWTFTIFMKPTAEVGEAKEALRSILVGAQAKKFVFQLEQGEDTGELHWQGVVLFASVKRFSTLAKLFAEHAMFKPPHWERCKNWKASLKYCSKDETRVKGTHSGPWVMDVPHGQLSINKDLLDPLLGKDLYPWQEEVVQMISEQPDGRSVVWIYERVGGVGKSMFCKHLLVRQEGTIYVPGGKAADIHYVIAQHVETKGYPKVLLIDVPRVAQKYVSYQAVEGASNGLFGSTKYECKTVIYPPCHIICFSNAPPDYGKLSEDRWEVYEILPDKHLAIDGYRPPAPEQPSLGPDL